MDFYACKNVLKKEFQCYLLEWDGACTWKPIAHGYPLLTFDFYRQELFLNFKSAQIMERSYLYSLSNFKFSINNKGFVITIELNDDQADIALSFRDIEYCVKFKLLLIHYLHLRELIREKN